MSRDNLFAFILSFLSFTEKTGLKRKTGKKESGRKAAI
jgi:hypothetical protein